MNADLILIRRAVRTRGGARSAYPELADGRTLFVSVGRPSALGNPYRVTKWGGKPLAVAQYREFLDADPNQPCPLWYNRHIHILRWRAENRLAQLLFQLEAGYRLVLLCPCYVEGEPCHAEVVRERLLEKSKTEET